MTPRPSLFGGLTRRGRFRNAWAKAAAEQDPARCLERLRVLWTSFAAKHTGYADMWPEFLDFVLRGHAAPALTPADLKALEDIGFRLTTPESGLRQWDAVRPLLTAWDVRRQPRAACVLLTRMYHAPDVPPEERTSIARALVNRGARGDEQLAVYVDHLRGVGSVSAEQPMTALLAACLRVGFGADRIRLKRAGELARTLRDAQLPVPSVDLALGYTCLLNERSYADAVRHMESARAADPANPDALLGLVSAWTHNGDHDLVVAVARVAAGPTGPVVAAMGELNAMLAWLDEPAAPGPPLCTPARLAELTVRQLASDWLDFAIGRAHLLAGNAAQAADVLAPLADRHPEYPQWAYHAAWALALRGDRDGVARQFAAARDWPSAWTVSCLLLDADPGAADRVAEELDRHPPPDELADVMAARLAMARRERPAELPWRLDAPLPEALESLRTLLGQRLARGTTTPLDETARAVLAHLPLAEQVLWGGLAALPTDRGRGRALLERAAHRLGHPRAALVLAVHHLEEGRFGEAEHLLARFEWRTDVDFQVLRAWARARTDEAATADLERLAEQGSSRAHYALGSVYIGRLVASSAERRQMFAQQAAAEFRAALGDPAQLVPADAAALARCAELANTGAPATAVDGAAWEQIQTLPAPRRTAWLRWLIALAELTGEPAAGLLDAGEYLVSNMDDAADDHAGAPHSVALALARASLVDTDAARAGALSDLVGRLARRRPDPELARVHDLATAAIARAGGPVESLDGAPAARLVKAELALRDDDRVAAARELRAVTDPEPVAQLGPVLAGLLAGEAPDLEARLEIPPGLPRRTELAFRVADAARLAEVDADGSVTVLAPVIGDLVPAKLVNLRRGLRMLCAGVAKRRQPPGPLPDLILGMATDRDDDEDLDLVMLARCAAAVGDQQLAGMLWRDAVAEPITEEARAEYTRFLCHQAVLARRKGDVLEAAHQLLLAARAGSGRRLDEPAFGADEVAALSEVFGTAMGELSSSAARNRAKGEWQAMTRCLTAAREAGDERRAVLMFAQLEDLLALVERGEV
jgi:hypothetical protein